MTFADVVVPGEVGDRPRDAENVVTGPRREVYAPESEFEAAYYAQAHGSAMAA